MRCPTIVGRDKQLDALSGVIEAAARRHGRGLFLVGEAGVGKSRLIVAAAEVARSRGMDVLVGRAVRSGLATPYRALSEALLGALRLRDLPDTRELAPFRRALGVVVPEWRVGSEQVHESLVVVAEGVIRLLRALAVDRPSVLVLEDLHWADSETLGVLEYLVDNVQLEPLAVLATLRDEPTPALAMAHELQARGGADLIALGRLDASEVSTMASACIGSPVPDDVARMLAERADGLPFFVEELLASLVGTGALVRREGTWTTTEELCPRVPLVFADTVRHRLELLGEPGQRALGAAAILGRQFDWELVGTVADMGRDVLDVLRVAVDHRLLEEDAAGSFRFRHALTREAILAQLLVPERVYLAERALAALEKGRARLPGEGLELAASLAEQAGQHGRAAELLQEVARRALAAGALQSAAAAARRCTELAAGDDGLSVAGDELLLQALALAGDAAGVEEVGERVLVGLARLGASASRTTAAQLLLARCASGAGEWSRARSFLEAARAAVDDSEGASAARIEVQLAAVSLGENRIGEARARGERALALARTAGCPDVVCEALEVLGRCARTTDVAHAEASFEEALRVADDAGLALWRVRALHELGTIDVMEFGETDRLVEARRAAEAVGALATAAHIDFHLAALHGQRCEFDAALGVLDRAEAAARRYRLGPLVPPIISLRATVWGFRGELAQARYMGQRAREAAPGDPETEARVRWSLAAAHLARDEISRARAECDAALSVLPPGSGFSQTFLGALGVLLHVLENPTALSSNEAIGAPAHLSPGLLFVTRAVVLGRQGRVEEAEAAFARGDELLARGPWLHHVVRRLVAEPAIKDGWGDPATLLRESASFFSGQGIEPLARACRSLLRKAGAPLPRSRSSTQDGVPDPLRSLEITAREADVLALVAEGLPNKEIAKRLYLSPRTIEKHVERLLVKTETANRAQLTAFAVRLLG
ncbi:MAG: AAA family ATPase [Actinomycetota bacterium]|nr:AAA family ATPase [Actinomycetota bacterium]